MGFPARSCAPAPLARASLCGSLRPAPVAFAPLRSAPVSGPVPGPRPLCSPSLFGAFLPGLLGSLPCSRWLLPLFAPACPPCSPPASSPPLLSPLWSLSPRLSALVAGALVVFSSVLVPCSALLFLSLLFSAPSSCLSFRFPLPALPAGSSLAFCRPALLPPLLPPSPLPRVAPFPPARSSLSSPALPSAVFSPLLVRFLCGFSFSARRLSLSSRPCLPLFSLLPVSRRSLLPARALLSPRVVRPAGPAFPAFRRPGVSLLGPGWFFRLCPLPPAVGPSFCPPARPFPSSPPLPLE